MYLILFRFQLCDANYDLFIQVKLNEVIVINLEEVMPFMIFIIFWIFDYI
jgi:hypothetical protein